MTSVICTHHLSCHFGPIKALQNLNLQVPSGSIFGFLGHNGAGKTTTIRLLLGLLKPTEGTAEVLGFDTQRQGTQIRYYTGALLEDPGLYGRLSAWDNLDFFARIWRIEKKEREKRIKGLLSHMGLWERAHEQIDTWSRGMKQKLAISRVLLHRPALIFMDEPTAGLDPVAASTLREDISQLVKQEGVSIFLTTHNLEEAEKLCHQMAIIRQGRLVAYGQLEDLKKGANNLLYSVTGYGFNERILKLLKEHRGIQALERKGDTIHLELKKQMEISSLVSTLVGEGIKVEEVKKVKGSLEETFLRLMEENQNERE